MASKDPFNFVNSPSVPPIPCMECGNHMHCVRRAPEQGGEKQLFMCATCGHTSERVLGLLESDHEIQKLAEVNSGLSPK